MVLFPLGVRLSTWLGVAAFAAVAGRRRSVVPLVAAWVWLISFEAVFDGLGLVMYGYVPDRVLPLILGVFTVAWCAQTKLLRVSLPWVAVTVVVWAVWLSLGFHWNDDGLVLGGLPQYGLKSDFRWSSEVLNEATKTAWALAYLIPLVRRPRKRGEPGVLLEGRLNCALEEDAAGELGRAAAADELACVVQVDVGAG